MDVAPKQPSSARGGFLLAKQIANKFDEAIRRSGMESPLSTDDANRNVVQVTTHRSFMQVRRALLCEAVVITTRRSVRIAGVLAVLATEFCLNEAESWESANGIPPPMRPSVSF